MNIEQIENNLTVLSTHFKKEEFIFDLMLAYGMPKATITLLKKGQHNLSKKPGVIILKRKLYFQEVIDTDLHNTIDTLQKDKSTMRHNPRFIVVTDYHTLLAVDTKTNEHLDIQIKNVIKHYDFFLPWAGIEKHKYINENPADRKAAEKMARLYDEILAENNIEDPQKIHDLNVFLSRLLFCFFAEDTNIFEDKLFTNSIASHTQIDGSDFDSYLSTLFDVLNSKERSNYPSYLQKFPYVNGGLFAIKHWIPKFSLKSRKIIIECGELNWSKINPDIFGSMMQAVVHSIERGNLGMHYTSVPNIMKVIEPLFLNEFKEVFETNKDNKNKLKVLLNRITHAKFFDPACGSGNFLIITYKELRRLEMAIIKELGMFGFSGMNLSQFYGIEIDDFAHEIAKLSLYLAEHQMNIEFLQEFGKVNPTLPLKIGGNILRANATRIEWEKFCEVEKNDEIYVLGNPPYLGARNQDEIQKSDIHYVLRGIDGLNSLDYISCWFYKAALFVNNNIAECAFVSTNSICQGEQVSILWPHLLSLNIEIGFAYQSFKWANNAKKNAGVICVIIGIRQISKKKKVIFNGKLSYEAQNISPYLTDNRNIFIYRRTKSINALPPLVFGNQAIEGGHLILSDDEKNKLLKDYPNASKFIRRMYGAEDFIKGLIRWCIWVSNEQYDEANKISPLNKRFIEVKKFRENKGQVARSLINVPYKFRYTHVAKNILLILPRTTSERRSYLPIGFLNSDCIVTDAVQVIYDPELYAMGVLSSNMHMVWVKSVAGRLKTDFRYSNSLCYNTFPIPNLTIKQKEEITRHVYNILEEREKYSEKTMAQLYDPDKMPDGLRDVHKQLDLAVERCYRSKPFINDEERLEYLFKLYELMIKDEDLHNI